MKSKVDLSILIISYNTKKITEECLNSIFKSLKGTLIQFEVIVLDNQSQDGSVAMLKKLSSRYKQLSFIESDQNLGFAKGNNLLVKRTRGKYLLFLNSDIIVLDEAIEKLYQYYRTNEGKINFLGGKLYNQDMTPQPSCGPFYSLPVIFGALFLRGDYWGLTRYSPYKPKKVDWISGACIMTRKKIFQEINGFDEKIFMYMDEIDLLYRAHRKGLTTFFYPQAKFIHLGSASSNKRTYPIIQTYQGFVYFYHKHHPKLKLNILFFMLKLKAFVSIIIGKLLRNDYLINTYEKALKIIQVD